MIKTMRALSLLSLVALLAACGGGEDHTGVCNICPSARAVNTDQCAVQGAASKCASAEIKEVTDDDCNVGAAPTTHLACVFTGCETEFQCAPVVTF